MVGTSSERRSSARVDDPELRGRRAAPRARIGLRASTETLNGRGQAILLDISSAGAQLAGQGLPGVGKDVLLTCTKIEIFGTVLWADSGRCGVRFDEPLPGKTVALLRFTAAEAAQAGLSREDLQAAADWVSGLSR